MALTSFASFHVKKSQEVAKSEIVHIEDAAETILAEAENNIEINNSTPPPVADAAGDDKTMAIILALVSILILPFGLHNWYLGRKKQAIWQTVLAVLLITMPISWIWQLVDLFTLLAKGEFPE